MAVWRELYFSEGSFKPDPAKSAAWNVSPDLAVATAIPLIAVAVWLGVRRLHREAQAAADTNHQESRR